MTRFATTAIGGVIYINGSPISLRDAENLRDDMARDFQAFSIALRLARRRDDRALAGKLAASMVMVSCDEITLRLIINEASRWRLAAGHEDPHHADTVTHIG